MSRNLYILIAVAAVAILVAIISSLTVRAADQYGKADICTYDYHMHWVANPLTFGLTGTCKKQADVLWGN